ncbi:MAG TPA: hypothetical protein VK131_07950 [Candidatus Acidoferrales bacterium]|nr:hypothetical protein [Candidatus Acidoferrales bacterium]
MGRGGTDTVGSGSPELGLGEGAGLPPPDGPGLRHVGAGLGLLDVAGVTEGAAVGAGCAGDGCSSPARVVLSSTRV